ncbi:ABC transporter ATP-binding protein [Pyrococcus sp. ST04]|uniref:ABC transporter ATP-binding protein n=1 Tax=Pyrococcus sp. ST04 TaxID=1183377 RepID=UPI0002605AFF|nr:ABC transporter ATP-binding protein [Pyrococcus sp. ST04]AFK22810.1 putative sugar-binding transport ATP-binding protein [Pyrococcus sp. ST04]
MVDVRLENIRKSFPGFELNLSLKVNDGELLTLLGPSGCGKTTTLRIVAGLEKPDEGKVYFGEEDVTNKKPYERNIGMVFQDYALFPHMTVFENIAFGLKLRKIPKSEIERRVQWILELVGLKGLEERYPEQLSGGQQQRVALARALVIEPEVLLLDEPLSNLDAKVREKLRGEIRRIQKELGITTIYVTHDQEEAMAISDRIAVMNEGRIEQIDDPVTLYFNPKTEFVAKFLGTGNLIEVRAKDGKACLRELCFSTSRNGRVKIFFRPENVLIGDKGAEAEVLDYEILPGRIRVRLLIEDREIIAERPLEEIEKLGKKVKITVNKYIIL